MKNEKGISFSKKVYLSAKLSHKEMPGEMPEGYTFKEYDRGKGLKDICLKKMPGGIREYKKKKCLQEDAFDKRL